MCVCVGGGGGGGGEGGGDRSDDFCLSAAISSMSAKRSNLTTVV